MDNVSFCVTGLRLQYSQTLQTYRLQSKDIKLLVAYM